MFDRYLRQILRGATVGILLFGCFIFCIAAGLLEMLIPSYQAEIGFVIVWLAAIITFLACVVVDITNPAALSDKKEERPTPSIVWCAAVNFAVFVLLMNLAGMN